MNAAPGTGGANMSCLWAAEWLGVVSPCSVHPIHTFHLIQFVSTPGEQGSVRTAHRPAFRVISAVRLAAFNHLALLSMFVVFYPKLATAARGFVPELERRMRPTPLPRNTTTAGSSCSKATG